MPFFGFTNSAQPSLELPRHSSMVMHLMSIMSATCRIWWHSPERLDDVWSRRRMVTSTKQKSKLAAALNKNKIKFSKIQAM